ncbi:MAG: hypothetical protein ACOYID_05795, partial [Eubacteriales bacterium]
LEEPTDTKGLNKRNSWLNSEKIYGNPHNNNDTASLDRLIKVLIAIILAVVAYYLIFGFKIVFTFTFI